MEYQNLGKSGLKVSKIILGAMSYGSPKWQAWVKGEEESLALIKAAWDHGINTWDTADLYSNGESERIIGKALKKYQIDRKRVVILTKCYFGINPDDVSAQLFTQATERDQVNQFGLSRKHIFDAVDGSIERLGTYIDVLQIHRLDQDTPKEEIMKALHDVVQSGKVRYIGASSMAAWEFQMLQNIAEKNGWTKFISMQNYHNLLYREEEREMIPYCKATGVGLIPWSPLAGGSLARPYKTETATVRQKSAIFASYLTRPNDAEIDEIVIGRVEELAKKSGVSMAIVATAWSLHKGVQPILGLSSVARIEEAVKAVSFKLSDEDIKYLEEPYLPRDVRGF